MSLIREHEEAICERSEGNPGAINVMCFGLNEVGQPFWDALLSTDLRGSRIWTLFKDGCGKDVRSMTRAMQEGDYAR